MKRRLGFLAALACLIFSTCQPSRAAQVVFNFSDFSINPTSVKSLLLYPVGGPWTNGNGIIITRDRKSLATGTNGSVTISNLVAGAYRGELNGWTGWTTNYFFFPDTTNTISAADYTSVSIPSIFAYSQTVADGRFVKKAGDSMSGPLTNNFTFYGDGGGLTNINSTATNVTLRAGNNIVITTNAATDWSIASTGGGSPAPSFTNSIVIWVDPAGDDSIAARGVRELPSLTLTNAARLSQVGDTIRIMGGTYDVYNVINVPTNGAIVGDGDVKIRNFVSSGTTILLPVIHLTDNCRVEGITVTNCLPASYQASFGASSAGLQSPFTNAILAHCVGYGDSDCWYLSHSNACSAKIIDPILNSHWDAAVSANGAHYIEWLGGEINCRWPSLQSDAAGVSHPFIATSGTNVFFGTYFSVVDAPTNCFGVTASGAAARVDLIGCRIFSSSTNGTIRDVAQASSASVNSYGTIFDMNKVTGTVNYFPVLEPTVQLRAPSGVSLEFSTDNGFTRRTNTIGPTGVLNLANGLTGDLSGGTNVLSTAINGSGVVSNNALAFWNGSGGIGSLAGSAISGSTIFITNATMDLTTFRGGFRKSGAAGNQFIRTDFLGNLVETRDGSTLTNISSTATNLSPWTSDINAAGFGLTNAGSVQISGLTASRVALTDGNKFLTSATASGAVPIDADGTATTAAQLITVAGGTFTTNNATLTSGRLLLGNGARGATTASASGSSVLVAGDGTAITVGSGLSLSLGALNATAGAITPWTSDINGNGFKLTNAIYLATNIHPVDANANLAVGTAMPNLTSGVGNIGYGGPGTGSVPAPLTAITTGSHNVGYGWGALGSVTTGSDNIAMGDFSLQNMTTALGNTAIGAGCLAQLTTGNYNTAIGNSVLTLATTGGDNIGLGDSALFSLTNENGCIALGKDALYNHKTGSDIIAIGRSSMINGASRSESIGIGANTLQGTTGDNNIAIGHDVGFALTTGNANTAIGRRALLNGTTSTANTIVGEEGALSLTTGNNNVIIGKEAAYSPNGNNANATTTGGNNVIIGFQSGQSSSTQQTNSIAIGYQSLFGAQSAVALGATASAANSNSVALGYGSTTTTTNQIEIGGREIELSEKTDPAAPAANAARIYARDNGSSKTELVAAFNTGTFKVFATESDAQPSYSTNTSTMAPDFSLAYSLIVTNAAFTLLDPINRNASKFETAVMYVTNSTASAIAITPAAGWTFQGTWYVTNLSVITVSHYGLVNTNAVCLPLR